MSETIAKSQPGAAAKPVKKTKPAKAKAWRPLTSQDVCSRLATGVHFSSKPVNTNASPVGVRLASDTQLDHPLIGFVTTKLDRRVVDYQDGAVAGAMLSQCASVIEGGVDSDYKDVPPEQKAMILGLSNVLDEYAEVGTGLIDPRLRQVLFPLDSVLGTYVSLTPLHSSVFSAELRGRLQAEAEKRNEAGDPYWRTQTALMVGGSKAQNVGRIGLVGSMQRALVFAAPTEKSGLREAYALFHKGVSIGSLVRRSVLTELAKWRETNRVPDGRIESTAALRQKERDFLTRIATEAFAVLEEKRDALAPYVAELGGWASEDLDAFERSLLDKDARTQEWPRQLASRLLRIVEGHKLRKDARPLAGFGDVEDYLDILAEGLK